LEDVIDLYVAREGLEAEIARLAVERITNEQLDDLKICLQSMHDAFESKKFEQYSELNQQFHGIIHDASGNKTLPELIAQIRLRLARLNLRVILLPGRGDSSYQEHTAIYEGLAERNSERASQAVRQHISAVRSDVENGWNLIAL
jgi:DNA-binding GntR family transcriptional regulator